jgi:hypothetical protein
MAGRYLFMGLGSRLEGSDFSRLVVSGGGPEITVTPLHRAEGEWTFRVVRGSNPPQVVDLDQVLTLAEESFSGPYDTLHCEMLGQVTHYEKTPRGVSVRTEARTDFQARSGSAATFDEKHVLESPEARRVLAELGVVTARGVVRRKQRNKLIQIKNLAKAVYGGLQELRLKTVCVVDAACGKSYLSFVLYYYLHEELGYPIHFTGIDANSKLIERSREIQATLGYRNMEFHASTVADFQPQAEVDLLYSLHGCDTATDEAIALGVRARARMIIVVPCCHEEIRGQLGENDPLRGVTRYGLFKEQFATLLTDSLRALALEAEGYRVAAFRFVTPDVSTRNVLLRALHTGRPSRSARAEYDALRDLFGVRPSIARLLGWGGDATERR